MPVRLRNAVPADAPALGAVHVTSWREAYAGLLPDAMLDGLSAAARAAMWLAVLTEPALHDEASVHVALANDEIIGFGACCRQRDPALARAGFGGEVSAVYVLRAHQGGGAGQSLMRRCALSLAGQDHRAASLWVLRANTVARRFYERLGGEIVGAKEDDRQDTALSEVAYGWRDLSQLCA